MTLHRIFYIKTIFISAFLLFLVQPMIAKMILPQLGGSPSVWQTVMLFFQSLLLIGYVYVTITTKKLTFSQQKKLHLTLTAVALIFLPLGLYLHDIVDRSNAPIMWLFISLSMSVGLPFFVLSANAPLLQRWFSLSDDESAKNPYFLYSASNCGSLLALLSYPWIIEPYVTISGQTHLWSFLFMGFFVYLAYLSYKANYIVDTPSSESISETITQKPSLKTQLYWGFLSFIPSSLMLGVTNYITTDVASFPLLWILPLAIYLLSFILVFANGMPLYQTCRKWAPIAMIFPFIVSFFDIEILRLGHYIFTILPFLISFFVIAVTVHGRLSEVKPQAAYLTYFYTWMSIGGALGGVFNALIAPSIFNSVIEYDLVLFLSSFVFITQIPKLKITKNTFTNIINALSLVVIMILAWDHLETSEGYFFAACFICLIVFVFMNISHQRGLLMIWIVMISNPIYYFQEEVGLTLKGEKSFSWNFLNDEDQIFLERNFFGVSSVTYDSELASHDYHHGTTLHGTQFTDPEKQLMPVSYYTHILSEFKSEISDKMQNMPIGVTGLGVGTLSCFATSPNQEVDIFEIDPIVIDVASNPEMFTYLQKCPGKKNIFLGDARLKLKEIKNNKYAILILDAYSSDSLPVHLVTDEAFKLYSQKIKDDGILLFNISNRHLDLSPVLSTFAEKYGYKAYYRSENDRELAPDNPLVENATWVVMSKSNTYLPSQEFFTEHKWIKLENQEIIHWRDDYAPIISVME